MSEFEQGLGNTNPNLLGEQPESTSILPPVDRIVRRIPKENGARRLTIVGTPEEFPPSHDQPK